MTITKEMIDRFLSWKLPDDFSPDAGISFKKVYNESSPFGPSTHEPTGTNLLNAEQARQMLEHVLAAAPQAPSVQQAEPTAGRDLRDALWLDPECSRAGTCQSLKFKALAAQPSERPAPAGQAVEDAKKARRYEWLRATTNSFTNNAGHRINVKLEPEKWDEMIDAALASSQAERPAEEK